MDVDGRDILVATCKSLVVVNPRSSEHVAGNALQLVYNVPRELLWERWGLECKQENFFGKDGVYNLTTRTSLGNMGLKILPRELLWERRG